jgi:alpha-L-arabinofuranosidase
VAGYWGIGVKPQIYTASFHVKAIGSNLPIKFRASLRSNTGRTWAQGEVNVPVSGGYSEHQIKIYNDAAAPNAQNHFTLTFDTSSIAPGSTFYFGLVSLFGETFKGRKNGLRKDIAEAFHDISPKFLRFPGGKISYPGMSDRCLIEIL